MACKILIPQDVANVGKAYLQERGYEIRIGTGTSEEVLKREVPDCEAVLLRTAKLGKEVLRAGHKLKVISRHGVGLDNIDLKTAAELGIVVTYTPEANAVSVAEHTLALMLALAKNIVLKDQEMREGNFEIRNQALGMDLEGKVLGVVGLGRIGARVAHKSRSAFEMHVIGFDPCLSENRVPSEVELVDWDELFLSADFVTLHLPVNEQTRNIIGKKELRRMKPTAFLINTARGEIVREPDLLEALQKGWIAGAGLDVFQEEPLPENHPLFKLNNLLLSPHCASLTGECTARMALHAARGIDEVLSGRKPTWPAPNTWSGSP